MAAGDRRALSAELRERVTRLWSATEDSFLARCLRRYMAIRGTDRALVVAGQCFTAVIPLLIVVATLMSSGAEAVAESIESRFHLRGSAAEAVETLFERPPGAQGAITIGSVILLIASGLSLSRTLQRTYEAAWELPPRGLRGTVNGLAALGILLSQIMLLSLLAGLLREVPAGSVITLVLRAAVATSMWLALQYVLLGARVSWRRLVPGALVSGLGQQAITAASAVWMPRLITENTARYGVIGVAFALLSWLLVIAVVIVVGAVVSGELGKGAEASDPAA
jgi:membrane protein